ncbi:hypothetical protein [Alteribacillus iranensis]|uniref:Uncharacterized protein n=1 Tax=Alteribacillus iranensis TaxID=930128 RepID=A0A1I2C1Z0_9BACI|nr:hypothetical protein [Alteribacillus iranensis]SFE62158.1 hypothetical protein SAMN05192532_102632 [Alteribacillus iranensis]
MFSGEYVKKTVSKRWDDFDGVKIQRDLYSAFLIMNVKNDLCEIDSQRRLDVRDKKLLFEE